MLLRISIYELTKGHLMYIRYKLLKNSFAPLVLYSHFPPNLAKVSIK